MDNRNRIYGDIEDIRRELEGKTGFDKDIEDTLIERIAEIEKNNGAVPALSKANWIAMTIITVAALTAFVLLF